MPQLEKWTKSIWSLKPKSLKPLAAIVQPFVILNSFYFTLTSQKGIVFVSSEFQISRIYVRKVVVVKAMINKLLNTQWKNKQAQSAIKRTQ